MALLYAPVVCAALLLPGRARCAEPPKIVLTVDRREGPNWSAVDIRTVFAPTDALRFRFTAAFDGYLYAVNHGTSGRTVLLFPADDAGRSNRVQAGSRYTIPGNEGHFAVTGPAGYDTLYWLVTDAELTSAQEADLVTLPPAGAPKPGLSPRCDDKLFRARSICMDLSAGLRYVAPDAWAGQWAAVANPPPGRPVVYELRIAHR